MVAPAEASVRFAADGPLLAGLLHLPAAARGGVVFCHPHPQYGGDMHNNVVGAVVRRLQEDGWATLRFDFRGVGDSEGTYGGGAAERADAAAALAYLRSRSGWETLVLGGYSFGAMVALELGAGCAEVARMVGVAPPLPLFPLDFLRGAGKPTLLIAGDRDPYCPSDDFRGAVRELGAPVRASTLAGADHFFVGSEQRVAALVAEYLDA